MAGSAWLSEPRTAAGQWGAGGAGKTAQGTAKGKPAGTGPAPKGTRYAGGGKSLSKIAAAAGISEARLIALNPKLKGMAGTGRHVPAGTVLATSAPGEKAAARSQRSKQPAITRLSRPANTPPPKPKAPGPKAPVAKGKAPAPPRPLRQVTPAKAAAATRKGK